ncbi:MAG: fused MFS/spermidine synthase, partial [Alphaproteobacteria bacterium]|nr:fused MFS/spermidine synthase [Alphaproteobacteria bacterium]
MLKRKWFLYVTEFFAGMSVMAIELGASRLLAPYFSSSQIVWTIIIGAIMIAMALGNIWGGRSADKNPSPDRLYARLLIVAVWTSAIPFLGKYVIAGISLTLAMLAGQNFLIWASLFSCIVIFVFPLMLLGTVSPSLVKYTVNSLDDSGKTVGELNALNTIGSIIGTFTPTFITIPAVGTAWTFIIFAAVLLIISLIYFIAERRKLVRCVIAVLLAVGFSVFSSLNTFAFWKESGSEVYEDESVYNYLQVTETDRYVSLSTNVLFGVQSITRKDKALTGMYYDYALAAPIMAGVAEKPQLRILILGFGTGTYASQCRKYFPNCVIDGVEIDKKIIDLAYDRFYISRKDKNINTVEFDGRAFLRNAGTYDVIMVDAYRDITVPFQMSSVEFFKQVQEHLSDDGVMVLNLNMTSENKGSINDYLCDTVSVVFDKVCYVNCDGNREVFAFSGENVLDRFSEDYQNFTGDLKSMMRLVNAKLVNYEAGDLILTDDKAPVELLGMKVIDEIISDEISYYKEIF